MSDPFEPPSITSWRANDGTPLRVDFTQEVPDLWKEAADQSGEQAARAAYQTEARRVVGAMARHLPGGLFSAIFAVMCERQANLLIVREEG